MTRRMRRAASHGHCLTTCKTAVNTTVGLTLTQGQSRVFSRSGSSTKLMTMPPVFIPLSCVIEIGGIPLGINTTDKIFFELLQRRYGGFVSWSQPAFELDFDLIDASAFPESDVSVTKNSDSWIIARGTRNSSRRGLPPPTT